MKNLEMKNKPKSGAPKGNKNAVKPVEEKKTAKIEIRITQSEKDSFMERAGKQPLHKWVLEKLRR